MRQNIIMAMIIVGCVDYVLIPFEIELCIVQRSNAIVYQINSELKWNEIFSLRRFDYR